MRQEKADAPDLVRCWAQAEPARSLVNLRAIPVLVVQAEASYHSAYDHCTVAYLRQARVTTVRYVRLADIGIKGNGHMFAGESRKKIGRNQRGITERFVHPGPDFAYQICGEVGAQSLLVMIVTKKL